MFFTGVHFSDDSSECQYSLLLMATLMLLPTTMLPIQLVCCHDKHRPQSKRLHAPLIDPS
jgi:hypothetical protein